MPVSIEDRYDEHRDESSGFHVAGVVVYVRMEALQRVAHALATLPSAQVHGSSPDGKLVVTREGARSSFVAEQLRAIQAIPDVMSTALVYQHHDHADSLNEEIDDETDSSRVH